MKILDWFRGMDSLIAQRNKLVELRKEDAATQKKAFENMNYAHVALQAEAIRWKVQCHQAEKMLKASEVERDADREQAAADLAEWTKRFFELQHCVLRKQKAAKRGRKK